MSTETEDARRERTRKALQRMEVEGIRHFNEQLARIQKETDSTVVDIISDLHDLGLQQEARGFAVHNARKRAITARQTALNRGTSTPDVASPYTDPAFVVAANELAAALRDSTAGNNLPWIGITDLYHIAEDLLMRGWAKAPTNTTQEKA